VTSRTGVIDALERTSHSFFWAWSKLAARGSVVAVGCVVDQSVPAAHDCGGSLAHFVLRFVSCVGCMRFNLNG
jgi:hypothetical protein